MLGFFNFVTIMITIKNNIKKIKASNKQIKEYTQKILDLLNYTNFDIGIWLTTNQTIKKYNKKYRKKNKPTDILSFPFHTTLQAGEKIKPKFDYEKNLGDIIISLEYAKKDALKLNISLQKHLKILLVHGICHLLGYTHDEDEDYAVMQRKEQELLAQL